MKSIETTNGKTILYYETIEQLRIQFRNEAERFNDIILEHPKHIWDKYVMQLLYISECLSKHSDSPSEPAMRELIRCMNEYMHLEQKTIGDVCTTSLIFSPDRGDNNNIN